jgi:hypothetical protein
LANGKSVKGFLEKWSQRVIELEITAYLLYKEAYMGTKILKVDAKWPDLDGIKEAAKLV